LRYFGQSSAVFGLLFPHFKITFRHFISRAFASACHSQFASHDSPINQDYPDDQKEAAANADTDADASVEITCRVALSSYRR
jgi:hypothetical protein